MIPTELEGTPWAVKLALVRRYQGESLLGWGCTGPVETIAVCQLIRRQEWPQG